MKLLFLQKKVALIFLLNLFLLSPFFHNIGVRNEFVGLSDPVTIWNFVSSVLYILSVQLFFRRLVYAHIFLLPNYIFVLIDLFLIFEFNTRLSSGFILITLSNLTNAAEFIEVYAFEIISLVLMFVTLYLVVLMQIRSVEVKTNRAYSMIPFFMMTVLYGGVFAKSYKNNKNIYFSYMDVIEHDYSTSLGPLSQSAVVYNVLAIKELGLGKRKNFKFNTKVTKDSKQAEVYVLIIGESSGSNHWSLYGYERETTPKLKNEKNIIVYSDIITEWPLTQKSVPIILSRANVMDFSPSHKEKSLITAYKEAGFKTVWLGAQPFDRFAGNIHILASESDVVRFYSRKYDKFLLKPFEDTILQAINDNNKILIVMHTKGSHFKYKYRYPREYAKFPDSSEIGKKQMLINSYDNSIIYTDDFLANVISIIKKQNVISSLMYISDHGENLMEDDRKLFGHVFSNEYDLPVPMFVWYSDEYRRHNSLKIMNAEENKDKKLTTAIVFYSTLDMANISFNEFDEEMSVFSGKLNEKPRLVYDQRVKKIFNFDDVYR